MSAYLKSEILARRLGIPMDAAHTLRRAEMTLHRWAEQECGDGNDYASWSIERDDTTGKPYRAWHPHQGATTRTAIADREAGALRRVAQVCTEQGLYYFHQTDPRGCALYVSREPLNDCTYSTVGRAVSV